MNEKEMLKVVENFCSVDPCDFVFHGDCVEVNNGESWETYTVENFYDEFIGDD